MFDWARGSVLKQMIKDKLTGACWDPWLKGWSCAWPIAILNIPPKAKVLDVGPADNVWYAQYFSDQGCEAHVMDRKYMPRKGFKGWGISNDTIKNHSRIKFHLGLAGQKIGPKSYFDLITCISVMEHIYDSTRVLDPKDPLPHLKALADMIRMLKPGGVLVMTYDFFLNDMPHWRGWDYLADIALLQYCGLELLYPYTFPRSRTFIYNYEDTLFMAPQGILSFANEYLRSTSIGMMFKKPSTQSLVTMKPLSQIQKFILKEGVDASRIEPSVAKNILGNQIVNIIKSFAKNIKK